MFPYSLNEWSHLFIFSKYNIQKYMHTFVGIGVPLVLWGHLALQQGIKNLCECCSSLVCPSCLFFCPHLLAELAQSDLVQSEAELSLEPQHHRAAQTEHDAWERDEPKLKHLFHRYYMENENKDKVGLEGPYFLSKCLFFHAEEWYKISKFTQLHQIILTVLKGTFGSYSVFPQKKKQSTFSFWLNYSALEYTQLLYKSQLWLKLK